MRIVIDGRAGISAQRTGKGQWTLRVVEALLRKVPVTILTDGGMLPPAWQSPQATVIAFRSGVFWHLRVARLLTKHPPDAYIAPSSFIVPALVGSRVPCLPIVHDLIAFKDGPHDRKATMIERWTLPRALVSARAVCTISHASKSALVRQFPAADTSKIHVIFAGPSEHSFAPNVPDYRTIFCPATLCPRKNQMRLIEAYTMLPQTLRERFRLLLVGGRGWHDEEIIKRARSTPGVEWRGYVDEAEYRSHMQSCTVLAFPSLEEGFGLPVLDALQHGVPVLTSNTSSMPEIAGSCAVFVDPYDTESIAVGLQKILTDTALREQLAAGGPIQARQFSWERTAELLLSALRNR